MGSNVVRADFGSGLICPRAQTCMDSKVVRADFGSGLIRPWAQTCCAELRRLARLANSPGFKSFRCPRERIKFSLERFSDQSRLRAQPLESSLGRVPQAADDSCNKIFANWIVSVAEDCVSPERTFHGCSRMHFRGCFRGSIPLPFPPRKITAASEARSQ